MQQQSPWRRTSVVMLLCAMTLMGVALTGLGLFWRIGLVPSNMLGLFFLVGTALVAALLFYTRTRGSQVHDAKAGPERGET